MSEELPDIGESLPFEDLFAPLVLDARARLRQKAAAAKIALLHAEAHAGWERYLLRRLSNAGSKAALCQFQTFKTVQNVFPAATTAKQRPADSLYREFVSVVPAERLRKLFREFPALLEYCKVLVSNWITTVSEFLDRLQEDCDRLEANFAAGPFNCPVIGLRAGLSDSHHGGRCVVRLTFKSGANLIYKPRSVAPEAHFSDLLQHFNAKAIPHVFRPVRCWERNGYGWMESVESRPCNSLAEVHAFYWRAGALLALVHLARGVDMHRENMIAAGAFPTFIDLETLWHPQEHLGASGNRIAASVIRTGFLPYSGSELLASYEASALSRRSYTEPSVRNSTHLDLDNAVKKSAKKAHPFANHLPVLENTEQIAPPFLPDILAGFRWIGELLLGDRVNSDGFKQWIFKVAQCPRRRVRRSTAWYRVVLEQLTSPQFLRSKRETTAELSVDLKLNGFAITRSEWRALRQLDLPHFKQPIRKTLDRNSSLPIQTKDAFSAQERIISNALATAQNR